MEVEMCSDNVFWIQHSGSSTSLQERRWPYLFCPSCSATIQSLEVWNLSVHGVQVLGEFYQLPSRAWDQCELQVLIVVKVTAGGAGWKGVQPTHWTIGSSPQELCCVPLGTCCFPRIRHSAKSEQSPRARHLVWNCSHLLGPWASFLRLGALLTFSATVSVLKASWEAERQRTGSRRLLWFSLRPGTFAPDSEWLDTW